MTKPISAKTLRFRKKLATEKPKAHGGARPGAGRKPLGDEPTVMLSARVTTSQREKYGRLGGAAWLRERIEKARET